MSGTNRIVVLAAAALVAIVGFFVAQNAADDDGASTTSATTPTATQEQQSPAATTQAQARPEPEPTEPKPPLIVVDGGEPEGGVQQLSFEEGGTVAFRVRSSTSDEIHVHGYDETVPLPPGETVRVRFPADITGRFEVELHHAGTQIARLEVTP